MKRTPIKAKRKKRAKRISPLREADRIFSARIRARGECENTGAEHKGSFQCAHGFSRRYKAVRWDERNAFCLCAGCHWYFTNRPLEWDEWMRQRMGADYETVRLLALKTDTVDVKAELERLKAAP